MVGALAAGAVAVAAGDLLLVAISFNSRTVLAGVGGVVGIPLVAITIATGLTGGRAEAALVIALIFLIVGLALYGLGRAFERLLDADPEDGGESTDPAPAPVACPSDERKAARDGPLLNEGTLDL